MSSTATPVAMVNSMTCTERLKQKAAKSSQVRQNRCISNLVCAATCKMCTENKSFLRCLARGGRFVTEVCLSSRVTAHPAGMNCRHVPFIINDEEHVQALYFSTEKFKSVFLFLHSLILFVAEVSFTDDEILFKRRGVQAHVQTCTPHRTHT